MAAGPDIDDYIAFFGDVPQWVHEKGWYYGARFVVRSDDDELTITVAPDEAEMDVVLLRGRRQTLRLRLKMVVEWLIEMRGDARQLLVRVNTGPSAICGFDYCLVRLKPHLEVDCCMSWGPGWQPGSDSALPARRATGTAEL